MYTKILVPVDGSPTSNRGLDEAIKLARLTGAKLKLLHVVDLLTIAMTPEAGAGLTAQMVDLLTEGGKTILADARARVQAADLDVDTELIDSLAVRVCDQVVDVAKAWGADLIVIGTHGRRDVGRLMIGSDAEQIVRRAPAPVLLVRAAEAAP
jgi:nucleotide-binding universal stress UspA family protein